MRTDHFSTRCLEMTVASVSRTSLNDRELMIARVAALAAVDARPASYLLNMGAASDAGLTLEDAQGALIAVAPIVGTAQNGVRCHGDRRGPRAGRGHRGRHRREPSIILTRRHSFAASPQSSLTPRRPEDSWPTSVTPLGHAQSRLLGQRSNGYGGELT